MARPPPRPPSSLLRPSLSCHGPDSIGPALGERSVEHGRVGVQLRDDVPVHLHHGDSLEEPRVQLVVGVDVDLAELEPAIRIPERKDPLPGLVAEMAPLARVEDDVHAVAVHPRYSGYGAGSENRAAE